jgi:small subunit ribosomal protein S19
VAQKHGGGAKAARRRLRKRASLVDLRKKKEFTYRGYTLDEMKAMTFQEVIELLPSRARRTFVRGLDREQAVFVETLRANGTEEAVRTHCRDVPVLPEFVGKKVAVHNGKEFVAVDIKPEMIGHYLGEFAMTRKSVAHSGPGVGATRSSKFMPLK